MTSRPGPGIHESLQNRGGPAPPRAQVRRQPSTPANSLHNAPLLDCIDPNLEAERPPTDDHVAAKGRASGGAKNRPVALEGIHTSSTDAVRPPPRGMPQVFTTSHGSNGNSNNNDPPNSERPIQSSFIQFVTNSNLPLPPRPSSAHPIEVSRRIIPGGTGVKEDPNIKSQSAEAAPPPASLAGGATADLFPWTGNQPEDTLSEALVKGGISNKPQIMNETNTARPSLWPNLKNKSGITTLSTLFVAALEKRQASGRLTTPNTFKPPPRLTLRDSTREQWLHDLALVSHPLRRLSRTIPHGLTGKVLLDQCLNKKIPLPRAIWLSKCVGINELRAHKRKGQQGTASWVRGWTISVEQFLEGAAAALAQPDWKPRFSYALQLVTQLLQERLLEEGHFLDWMLRNVEFCPPERLSLWLSVVSVYQFWEALKAVRPRGKRLAEAILGHLDKLYQLDEEGHPSSLTRNVEYVLIRLLGTKSVCLLLPKTWATHGAVLHLLSEKHGSTDIKPALARLEQRVKRIARPSRDASPSTLTSVGHVYYLLDAVDFDSYVCANQLAHACADVINNETELIPTVLQWASSLYRQGVHQVYLATRVIRALGRLKKNVYDGIVSYLCGLGSYKEREVRVVFKIVAELVRSKSCPLGRLLQWLIATGYMSQHQDFSSPAAWPLHLLTEMPLHSETKETTNLRYTLLRGSIYSTQLEEKTIYDTQYIISQHLPTMFRIVDKKVSESAICTDNLSGTVKLEIGVWLRQQAINSVGGVEQIPSKDPSTEAFDSVSKITLLEFNTVRSLLETLGDFAMLADVVGIATTSLDSSVLASAADTLMYNRKTFRALGAYDPLFQRIAKRYAAIRTTRFPERELLLSLTDLSRTVQPDSQLQQSLAYDLSRLEQRNSFAACSPASDNMDIIQGTGADNDDDIERILSSGTTMDQQMMARVFGKIIRNLEDQIVKGRLQPETHSTWFYRLRCFSETTFDLVLEEWLTSTLKGYQPRLLLNALPPLVTSRCISLSKFQELGKSSVTMHKDHQPAEAFKIAVEILRNLLPTRPLIIHNPHQEAYRYRLEQQKLCFDSDSRVLDSIRDVIELGSVRSSEDAKEELSGWIRDDTVLTILKHHIISDSRSLWIEKLAGHQDSETMRPYIKYLLDTLLDPTGHMGLSQKSLEQQVLTIFENVDELSLRFSQLLIEQVFLMSTAQGGAAAESVSTALLSAIKTAVEKDQRLWSDLIAGLESNISSKIREHAERELLSGSAYLTNFSASVHVNGYQHASAFIRRYLTVIDYTAAPIPNDDQSHLLTVMTDRFKGVVEALNYSVEFTKQSGQPDNKMSVPVLCCWLVSLLRIAVERCPVLLQKATQGQQKNFMWSMRSLIMHRAFQGNPTMLEYIYDVALILSDNVAEDVRNQIAQTNSSKKNGAEPYISFIFGPASTCDAWLVLSKPMNPLPTLPTLSQTPSQGLSQGQSQGQSQPSPNSPTTSSQRSLSQQQQSQQQQQMLPGSRSNSQYAQPGKVGSPLYRIPSNLGQGTPSSQFQQLQQMQSAQGLGQQRPTQSPISQPQRTPSISMQSGSSVGKASVSRHEKPDVKHFPFIMPRWETLPDSGATATGNDTAISLGLFGARKV